MIRHIASGKTLCFLIGVSFIANSLHAQTAIQVVNAASYAPSNSFAPGTIVAILGANLTNTVEAASNAANPPTTLGGVSVSIGGKPAGLFFVSPGQINAHIDAAVPTGSAAVMVTSPTGTFTTSIGISTDAAAGLFSIAGSGSSDGAILNAITFALGPFAVTSPMGPAGSPTGPTYLAIYLTGLNLSASPQVTIGGVQVPVVYFGNAPCCAGLEQINVQLLPKLAGAGRVHVVVTAAGTTSNVVDVTIVGTPANSAPKTVPNLTGVVAIPNTNLGLVVNATANTVQVVNTSNRVITRSIPLPAGAGGGRIAVNSAGSMAFVVEHALNAVAVIDLKTYRVLGQVNVGRGPVSVSIVGNRAFVVNQDSDSVTAIDIQSLVPLATIAVGRAPSAISVDTTRNRLLITNSASGTMSIINLSNLKVTSTVPLTSNSRPLSVHILDSLDIAVLTDASLKPGQILVIDLRNDSSQAITVNGTEAGSWTAAAVSGNKVFLTDAVDGEIGIVTFSRPSDQKIAQTTKIVNVQPGVQRLDVDAAQNLLIIVQSNGQVMIFDLTTNKVLADVDSD
jgi:uncharacterized protein (TIGR03437 family)